MTKHQQPPLIFYLRSSDQEIDCADIGISAPSAKLIQEGNRFLGLRDFGEICRKPKHHLYKKTSLTLTKLIYPPIIPINIKLHQIIEKSLLYKAIRSLAPYIYAILSVTGHLRNTLHTSTCFHRLSNQRPTTRLPQSTAIYGNLPFSTIFYHILLNSAKSN